MNLTKDETSSRDRILAEIDQEIAALQRARILLAGGTVRNVSPEGRQRISQAVSRRWQQYRKAKKSELRHA